MRLANHLAPDGRKDEQPADRIADQPDEIEVHEIARKIAFGQAKSAEQAFG